jgi:transposase
MGTAISEDLRWRVVYLFYDSYSIQEIAALLKLSMSTIKRIIACYQQWKCVINPLKGQTGRRKIFNGTDMKVSLFIVYLFMTLFFKFICFFYRYYVKL